MKKARVILLFYVMLFLFGCSTEKHYNEWVMKGNDNYYYNNSGEKLKNVEKSIEGSTYFFDSKGKMCSGFQNVGGKRKYYDKNGKRLTGWQRIENNYYYFDTSNGEMQTGWIQDYDKWYYCDENGIMKKNAWVDNNKYYVDENGVMLKNTTINIGGQKYTFDANGTGREAPYFSDPGWKINIYLKNKLPVTRGDHCKWKIYDNLEMSVVPTNRGLYLYVNGIIELVSKPDYFSETQTPYDVVCRLSMVDDKGVTSSTKDYANCNAVTVGEKAYVSWKVGTLPLMGGNIDMEFLTD